MEAALLKLLGLALAHVALARRRQRVMLLMVDGNDVIESCLRRDPIATAKVVSETIEAFWTALKDGPIPDDQLTSHVDAMSDLIKSAGGCPCKFESADEAPATNEPLDPEAEADRLAQRISATITERTNADEGSPKDGRRTLAALFGALLTRGPQLHPCLDAAADAVNAMLADGATRGLRAEDRTLRQLQQQLANDTGISMPLLNAIIAAQGRLGSPIEATAQTLVDRTVTALELLASLVHLADRSGKDSALEDGLNGVVKLVRAGTLAEASCQLAALSRGLETSDDIDALCQLDLAGTAVFPALLAAQARLASLDGEPREAARLFERAVKAWPREDRLNRWELKVAQARQLIELGRLPNARINVLYEAAQIYAAAGGLISEQDCPLKWAEANLELGTLLLYLGNRECRPERYLAAALHFKPAIEVFTRERAMDGWARSQIGLAHALRGQASFQGDVIVAREAAFAYRAALGILTEDGTPELWHEARCALGDTLVLIAEEAGDIDSLQKATDLLMSYSQSIADVVVDPARAIGEIAIGRAMLFLIETGQVLDDDGNAPADDDINMLNDAIGLIGNALKRDADGLTDQERARAERYLGSAYWLHFVRTGEAGSREAAVAHKRAAQDLYQHLDNLIEAERLADEIGEMNEMSWRAPEDGWGAEAGFGEAGDEAADESFNTDLADIRAGGSNAAMRANF